MTVAFTGRPYPDEQLQRMRQQNLCFMMWRCFLAKRWHAIIIKSFGLLFMLEQFCDPSRHKSSTITNIVSKEIEQWHYNNKADHLLYSTIPNSKGCQSDISFIFSLFVILSFSVPNNTNDTVMNCSTWKEVTFISS
jgi:hypothetical protein